jgi:hypothetical protein
MSAPSKKPWWLSCGPLGMAGEATPHCFPWATTTQVLPPAAATHGRSRTSFLLRATQQSFNSCPQQAVSPSPASAHTCCPRSQGQQCHLSFTPPAYGFGRTLAGSILYSRRHSLSPRGPFCQGTCIRMNRLCASWGASRGSCSSGVSPSSPHAPQDERKQNGSAGPGGGKNGHGVRGAGAEAAGGVGGGEEGVGRTVLATLGRLALVSRPYVSEVCPGGLRAWSRSGRLAGACRCSHSNSLARGARSGQGRTAGDEHQSS